MRWLPLIAGSYLLGSVSFSYLIVRLLRGLDVRRVGSGNAGATNVLRSAGAWPAVAALVLDLGKGAAVVAAAQRLEAPPAAVGGAALAVVAGHFRKTLLAYGLMEICRLPHWALFALWIEVGASSLSLFPFKGQLCWRCQARK
jgi:glycerol-3-phosphate acyltransferase PlsY